MLTQPIFDRDSALEFLLGRINYERTISIPYRESEFKLDRMRQLLQKLGDPHLAFPAIHIAGTKGKGSTAAMTASALDAAGYRTGLYTSPHLERLEERFTVSGQQCSEREFISLAADVAEVVARLDADGPDEVRGATFFEVTTAMGFLHFARQEVDLAVLEVGLGGRLDSTNVCQPLACAVTSISFDHTKQLGNTLAEIAAEKAGIAKRGVPLVCGVVEDEPRRVIEAVAHKVGAPVLQVGTDYGYVYHGERRMDYWDRFDAAEFQLSGLELAMPGRHQAANAACAVALLRQLAFVVPPSGGPSRLKPELPTCNLPEATIRAGLNTARCPARVEVLVWDGSPSRSSRTANTSTNCSTIIMDAAHNAASVSALLQSLEELAPQARRLLIFGTTLEKDLSGMLRLLLPNFAHIIFTRYVINPRAVDPTELMRLALDVWRESPAPAPPTLEVCPTPATAWDRAQGLQSQFDLTCITGSFFLAAELRPLITSVRVSEIPR